MPLTREIPTFDNYYFSKPLRGIFSGSSQSGKTYLIGKMLEKQNLLFGEEFNLIKYFYPEYLEDSPVDYHDQIDTKICYEKGFPSKESVLSLPENSLLIIGLD